MRDIETFNVLHCPLEGSNLLEASAGTGKTFSLVFLYLRLLLEKGLSIEQVLVATFTNAATVEISERIYQQLSVAAGIMNDLAASVPESEMRKKFSDDDLLVTWFISLVNADSSSDKDLAASDEPRSNNYLTSLQNRIRLAQAQFDEAVICSIDGFALRQLTEHADIVNSYVPDEIINNDEVMIRRVYLQLAKDDFIALGHDMKAVGEAVSQLSSPSLFSLLNQMVTNFDTLESTQGSILEVAEKQQKLIDEAVNGDHEKAVALIRQGIEDGCLKKVTYKIENLELFSVHLTDSDFYSSGSNADKFLNFFSGAQLAARTLKNKTFDTTLPLFDVFDKLVAMKDIMVAQGKIKFYQSLMMLAATIKEKLSAVKAEQMTLTFTDITQRVSKRAESINTPIKAALIDEAQDTNSQQLEMFQKMFMPENKTLSEEKICFFVGDLKQAIYGFRGANIYSYLSIQNLVDNRYELTKNYRSSQAFNDSVNYLFSGNKPFLDERITYREILSHKNNNGSSFAHESLSLVAAKKDNLDDLAATAAQYLDGLLDSDITIKDRPLAASDIAILVRSGSQAERIKDTLAHYGRAASFVGNASVYNSNEAQLVLGLLRAIAEDNVRLLRALMLTPLLDYPIDAVQDETIVNQLRIQLQRLADDYEKRGFAVMFYRMLNQFSMGGNLLVSTDGRRRLTNFIQLFELLQSALQQQSLSLAGLCDWLMQQIDAKAGESELRLEDDNAMTIMTIHKSKGLEFPVVCLPFFDYYASPRDNGESVLVSHSDKSAALSSLRYSHLRDIVNNENAAENRRLAYVALTRAQYKNIIIVQPTKDEKKSHATKEKSLLSLLLKTLPNQTDLATADFTHEENLPEEQSIAAKAIKTIQYQAKDPEKSYSSAWLLDSFSRLLYQIQNSAQASGVQNYLRESSEHVATPSALMDFPAGPRAGSALHEIYEHYMANRQLDECLAASIGNVYNKYLPDHSDLPSPESVAQAIATTACMPLSPFLFCLNDIDIAQQSIEMKFFMHLPPLGRQKLYQRFGQHIQADSEGFVHGYIDYLFCHEDKYYVLDYKSNKLGNSYADYHEENMQTEMTEHHYEQQALIYTLALCKHLVISSEQSYNERIGGYIYLFIRGVSEKSAATGHGVFAKIIPWEEVVCLLNTDD